MKIIIRPDINNTKCLIDRDALEWQRHKGFSGRVCAFVDCLLHDVAGVSNAFSVNGSGYFSSASIFGESTATVDLWAAINYESPIESLWTPAMGIRSSSDALAIIRVDSTGVGLSARAHTQPGIESAAFKEERPHEFVARVTWVTICRSLIESNESRIKRRYFTSPTLPIVHTSQLLVWIARCWKLNYLI